MTDKTLRIVLSGSSRNKDLDILLPVLVSAELTERISKLLHEDISISVRSMTLPRAGREQGDVLVDCRLGLSAPDDETMETLISNIRGEVRQLSSGYRLHYRVYPG